MHLFLHVHHVQPIQSNKCWGFIPEETFGMKARMLLGNLARRPVTSNLLLLITITYYYIMIKILHVDDQKRGHDSCQHLFDWNDGVLKNDFVLETFPEQFSQYCNCPKRPWWTVKTYVRMAKTYVPLERRGFSPGPAEGSIDHWNTVRCCTKENKRQEETKCTTFLQLARIESSQWRRKHVRWHWHYWEKQYQNQPSG